MLLGTTLFRHFYGKLYRNFCRQPTNVEHHQIDALMECLTVFHDDKAAKLQKG
jgi:hypothetical protein